MGTIKNKVLVTGATGNTGGYAIKYLLTQQVPVRAPSSVPTVTQKVTAHRTTG